MKGIIILDFNRTLYNPDSQTLIEGAADFLKKYCEKYCLALIGKSNDGRDETIDKLDIKKYFKYIKLKDKKEESDFINCMNELDFSHDATWSIGDRIKREIVLSNRAKIKTIWMQNGKFADELPLTDEEKPSFIVTSFKEIEKIIPL